MDDKKKRFLNKVVELLIKDTIIFDSYFKTPFSKYKYHNWVPNPFPNDIIMYFGRYCIDRYGLTDDEIELVWEDYKKFVRDIILK